MTNISVKEAKKLQEAGTIIIDLRRDEERAGKAIPGTLHLPSEDITPQSLASHGLDESKKDDLIIVHCNRGGRAKRVRNLMEEMGFTQVKNLEGGIVAWKEAGLPIE
jgi:rhodanese-related sulfurtransferase